MIKYFSIVFLFVFSSSFLSAQNEFKSSSFVSGLMGNARVSNAGNSNETPVSLTFGGSFGVPVAKNLYLYTRASFSSKSNFQSFFNTSFINAQNLLDGQLVEVTSSFSQLLLNGGLLYNFILSEDWTLGLNGGMSFSIVNQEAKLFDGRVISSVNNEAIWGAFGGLIVEKYWGENSVSTFFEAQYNYAKSDAAYNISALNTMNYTFGVRYYLSR